MGNDQQMTADQMLSLMLHPAFQTMLQIIQKPLLDKIEKLEEWNNELILKMKQLEQATNSLAEKTPKIQKEKTKSEKTSPYIQLQKEKRNNLIITGIKEEETENLQKKITEFFEAKFHKTEIKFECERIGKNLKTSGENNSNINPRIVRVRFYSFWDKKNIYINRIKNLQNSDAR